MARNQNIQLRKIKKLAKSYILSIALYCKKAWERKKDGVELFENLGYILLEDYVEDKMVKKVNDEKVLERVGEKRFS